MPAKPRWLLSIPDAISQLENLDRALLTRRDRQPTDPAPDQAPAAAQEAPRPGRVRGEEERRARLVTELRKARITGIERIVI